MISIGTAIVYGAPIVLGSYALSRRDGTFQQGLVRAVEQFVKLVPRMFCALVAAGFVAKLIPTAFISRFLGDEAGMTAILIGTVTGLVIPSGPVVAFSIAATFAKAGAADSALVAFITAWTLFAIHRVVIYEIPLLGLSFLRLRLLSVFLLPLLAGAMTMGAQQLWAGIGSY
ncbi:hypothetical protein MDG893_15130 [Marinobacter algicola DG893]|uniref:Permease n=1 Tax=Marinobacter algicola DG893 TaxID=443152 RepID=A6F021_9GAMM|nr:hypothetical protein MDG893_15130 [Marinobacter algicola DG893]